MISKKMEQKLNDQINAELSAWYSYLSMSAYSKSLSLDGVATWFAAQSEEERTHAMKIYNYLDEQDASIELKEIKKPILDFGSIEKCFTKSLEQEKHVTKLITELMDLAVEEKDYGTQVLLQWFVNEQIEEEASIRKIIEDLKLIKDSGQGLFIFDREMMSKPHGHEDH